MLPGVDRPMDRPMDRRGFLRLTGAASLGLIAACSSAGKPTASPPSATPSPSTAPSTPTTTDSARPAGPTWRRIDAKGPPARRDHTFTGDTPRGSAYLLGGRTGATRALGDFWIFDAARGAWKKGPVGPPPRFGHNAAVIAGKLRVFGGQSGPDAFLNDVWEFDPDAGAWTRRSAGGSAGPAKRYGAAAAVIADRLIVTHGFTNSGRFDDTWALADRWTDVSPADGPRPIKRCLHRAVFWSQENALALFGGQTNGDPYLGDFWLYDPPAKRWRESKAARPPSPRNLFAMMALDDRVWIFGGRADNGALNDLHYIDSAAGGWKPFSATGQKPSPRSGIEAAVLEPSRALIFGGKADAGELSDLWEFNDPF